MAVKPEGAESDTVTPVGKFVNVTVSSVSVVVPFHVVVPEP
jgi:hypothetical protein